MLGFLADFLFGRSNPDKDIPGLAEARAASQQAMRFSAAAADPNSPEFQNLAALYEGQRKRDLADSSSEIMKRNRFEKARGGVGFGINPERRDEARYGALTKGFAASGDMAREEARRSLLQSAGGSAQAAQSMGPVMNIYGNAANQNRQNENILTNMLLEGGLWGRREFLPTAREEKMDTSRMAILNSIFGGGGKMPSFSR